MVVLVIGGSRSSKSIESNSCSNSIEQREEVAGSE